jgi:hypothetical protein
VVAHACMGAGCGGIVCPVHAAVSSVGKGPANAATQLALQEGSRSRAVVMITDSAPQRVVRVICI